MYLLQCFDLFFLLSRIYHAKIIFAYFIFLLIMVVLFSSGDVLVIKKMFDFEKLTVYQKAKEFNLKLSKEILSKDVLDKVSRYQLRRASMSIMLNIAEGATRFSNADKRNFFVIARGSSVECVAILDLQCSEQNISKDCYVKFYTLAEEVSKILYAMIRRLDPANTKK